jgi:hypothetical protein
MNNSNDLLVSHCAFCRCRFYTELNTPFGKSYFFIKKANELFTSYKEGWKTDRGMVYVIFGNPDRVFRENKKEIWLYGDIRFEFKIISNLFAPKMYVLLRDKGYEKIWIKKITDLRSAL